MCPGLARRLFARTRPRPSPPVSHRARCSGTCAARVRCTLNPVTRGFQTLPKYNNVHEVPDGAGGLSPSMFFFNHAGREIEKLEVLHPKP